MCDKMLVLSPDLTQARSLAQQLRAGGIYCRVLSDNATIEQIRAQDPNGIIILGYSMGKPAEFTHLDDWLKLDLPLFFWSDAAFSLCLHMGGQLGELSDEPASISFSYNPDDPLCTGLQDGYCYLQHPRMMLPPPGTSLIAHCDHGSLAFASRDRRLYAAAIPMDSNDQDVHLLLNNFCLSICACSADWSDQIMIDQAVHEIIESSAGGNVLCSVSGGVDSSVCALLANKAVGDRLRCIYIDTGLMHPGKGEEVIDYFSHSLGLHIEYVDASARFMAALKGITNTIEKANTVYRLLKIITTEQAAQHDGIQVILQGTIYNDIISGVPSLHGETWGGIPVLQPVRNLFKAQVRAIGTQLGLTDDVINRQSFPGSGLATRMAGEVCADKLRILSHCDRIFTDEVENANIRRPRRYYAVLSGDPDETGAYIITLCARQSADSRTAARLPWDLLQRTCDRILKTTPQVRSVLWDLMPGERSY